MEDLDPEEMRPVVDPGQPRGKLERYQQVFSGQLIARSLRRLRVGNLLKQPVPEVGPEISCAALTDGGVHSLVGPRYFLSVSNIACSYEGQPLRARLAPLLSEPHRHVRLYVKA